MQARCPIASNRMILVARQLGRVRDHSVDIAEQVGFLLAGGLREFPDAYRWLFNGTPPRGAKSRSRVRN